MSRLAWVGIVPILVAAASGAQNPQFLTEAEFLSAFDDQHPAVRESAEALARAEATARAAATLDNPTLGAVREDPSGPVRQLDLLASWQIPDAARWPEIEARKREVEAARARFEQARTVHRLAMREAYAAWAVAAARRERLESQAVRVESLARREAARTDKGEASGLEAHRLELAAGALRSRVALAAADADRARANASVWVATLPPDAVPVLPILTDVPVSSGVHVRVRAAKADLAAAELAREAAGRFLRSPEVSVGWQRQEVGSESFDGPILGLSWSVPLFDRKQAARNASEAGIDAARARLEIARREVSAERDAAERTHRRLRESLTDTRARLTPNERMLDGAEAAFRLGEASLTDLLETHRSVTEAELAALDLHEAALAAARELERLTGTGAIETASEPGDSIPSRNRKDIP